MTGLRVASTLCWIWGLLILGGGLALLIPALVVPGLRGAIIVAALLLACSAGYCVAGYYLRKARRAGAGLAICVAVLVSLLQIGAHTRAASVGLVVNIVIVVLIIMNWRHLQPAGTPYLPSP